MAQRFEAGAVQKNYSPSDTQALQKPFSTPLQFISGSFAFRTHQSPPALNEALLNYTASYFPSPLPYLPKAALRLLLSQADPAPCLGMDWLANGLATLTSTFYTLPAARGALCLVPFGSGTSHRAPLLYPSLQPAASDVLKTRQSRRLADDLRTSRPAD